jgi:hypothetical protein
MQAYEKRPPYQVGLSLELAHAFLEAGEEEQAHSLMFADKDAKLDVGTQFRLCAASGQLRCRQWLQTWSDSESRDSGGQVPGM